MRICLVSDSYPLIGPFGGVAVYTQTAARALAARGHSVHVVVGCAKGDAADLRDGDIPVLFREVRWLPLLGHLAPGLGESFHLARVLQKLHRKQRFDLIEMPIFEGLGLLTALMVPAPNVVRLHTSTAEVVEVRGRPAAFPDRYMMWAERQHALRAAGLVTHSFAHRDRMKEIYRLDEIEVIPHGIDLPPPPPADGPRDLSILTFNRLTARKGGKTLLQTIPRVLAAEPSAAFTVIGADESHALVQEFRAAHPALTDRVVFRRYVEQPELEQIFARSALYASASLYESFGLPFVEAMARGLPVIGSATSAMVEAVAHGETGLLVPPGDVDALSSAIVELLRDPARRARMAVAGRRRVEEKYTAERMAAEIEAWYQRVLDRRRRT